MYQLSTHSVKTGFNKAMFVLSLALLLHGARLYGEFIVKIEEGLLPPRTLPVSLPDGISEDNILNYCDYMNRKIDISELEIFNQ